MDETTMLAIAISLVATMFGLLCALIAWIGTRAINSIDKVKETLDEVAGELHTRINGLDRRVTIVETQCSVNHHNRRSGDGD